MTVVLMGNYVPSALRPEKRKLTPFNIPWQEGDMRSELDQEDFLVCDVELHALFFTLEHDENIGSFVLKRSFIKEVPYAVEIDASHRSNSDIFFGHADYDLR